MPLFVLHVICYMLHDPVCLAFPGTIISIDGQQATADFDGVQKSINIGLVPEVKKGDYVIVHAGFAIQQLTKEDAWEVLKEYEKGNKIICGVDKKNS